MVGAVTGSTQLYFTRLPRSVGPSTSYVADQNSGDSLKQLLSRVTTLRRALEELHEDLPKKRILRVESSQIELPPDPATVQSSTTLGLNLSTTAATLTGTSQVNTASTSYSPFGPTFSAGTSLPTVGGVYDGDQGSETLTFQVTRSGTVAGGGGRPLRVRVQRASGTLIEDIDFTETTPAGTIFNLSNGLKVSFSAGTLVDNATFTVAVSTTVPSSVNPSKPFNGVRNDNPNFDQNVSVTAGSFTINGTAIAVNANDTLTAVLARITASAAGVTAAYDAVTDKVTLTQKSQGSDGQITLGSDTSGFLVATKLSGASVVSGTDSDLDKPIAQVAALSGIQSGNFSINGTSFTINPATQSLADVLALINGSAAGVSTSYSGDRVTFTSAVAENSMQLSNGTSGFFTHLNVTAGTYQPVENESGSDPAAEAQFTTAVNRRTRVLGTRLRELNQLFRTFFDSSGDSVLASELQNIRTNIAKATESAWDNTRDSNSALASVPNYLGSGIGLTFDFTGTGADPLRVRDASLRAALRANGDEVLNFLFAESASDGANGFFAAVSAVLADAETGLRTKVGSTTGLLLNQVA